VKDDVYAVEIAPDSSFIAAGSWDDNVYALKMDGKELWNYSCGGNINSLDISRDSSTLAVGSDAGAVYLFRRNAIAFARLLGDESFLQKETVKGKDTTLEEKTIIPIKENTAVTGGIENRVEDLTPSTGNVAGNAKTGGDLSLSSEENSLEVQRRFDSIKFPLALLIGATAGTVFFLKRKLIKYKEINGISDDYENLEEDDNSKNTSGNS